MRPLLATNIAAYHTHDFGATNVDNTAWVQIVPLVSNLRAACAVKVLNTSSAIIKLATGNPGSEVELPYLIYPGEWSDLVPLEIRHGVRLSARAQTAAIADEGELVLNFFG